jgi:hypothetical protein
MKKRRKMQRDLKGNCMTSKPQRVNWEELERKYSIAIQANKATVSKRRWPVDKPVLTATAILGTKVVDVEMNSQNGVPGIVFDVDAEQTFTDANVAPELRTICLCILAELDAAQDAVRAGE